MVSRIIYDEPEAPATKFKSQQSLHDKVCTRANRRLKTTLKPRPNEDTKPVIDETVHELTGLLIEKVTTARDGLVPPLGEEESKRFMGDIDRDIGTLMEQKLEMLETHIPTPQAAATLGQVIRASIDSTKEITGVRASVPHVGRLEDLRSAHRARREFSYLQPDQPVTHSGKGRRR